MAAQTMSGAIPAIHKTLTTTNADLVTISGVGVRAVRIHNRHASAIMWAKRLNASGDAAVTASADGAVAIPAGKSGLVTIGYNNLGQAFISVVGNANDYSVELVSDPRLAVVV